MRKQVNIFKSLALAGGLLLTTTAFSQDAATEKPKEEEAPKTVFGGSIDTYSKMDFARGSNQGLTSFTNSNKSIELGMATINVSHKMGRASAFLDLGFGRRSDEFVYSELNNDGIVDETNGNIKKSSINIKQMYVNYDVIDGLTLTMGSWATHLGYELVDAIANRNYSMSYAFTNGPFLNTGAKANYVYDKFNLMVGLTQPTDIRSTVTAGTTQKTFISQAGYTADETSVYLNVTSGSTNPLTKNVSQFDLVASHKFTDKFSATVNGTFQTITVDNVSGSKSWFSTVGYLRYDHSDKLGLSYRGEYFNDSDAYKITAFEANNGGTVISNTLSLNYKVGNLTIIPEIRADYASSKIFADADAKATKLYGYVLLGTAYKF